MVRLYVNVDHVATLRQQRDTRYPDPVAAAALCELAGAGGITAHLREDRRHIQERDIRILRQTVRGVFNLEMAAVPEMVKLALEIKPDFCTLVPERRQEQTTEGGLEVRARKAELAAVVKQLQGAGIGVSLFIDPEPEVVQASADLGVAAIELHTGDYCRTPIGGPQARREIARLALAGRAVVDAGLRLAAGHGLDYANVGPVAAIARLEELNIGHGLIARAVLLGMDRAVRELKEAIAQGASEGGREG